MLKSNRMQKVEILTLDRESAGNSINSQLTTKLLERLGKLKLDDSLQALIITGAGDKFFCAGGDIKEYRLIEDQSSLNYTFNRTRQVMDIIDNFPIPVIAAVNGYALGGGAEMILCCDYRIAKAGSQIGWPQTRLGIIPAWNGIDRLVRDCGPRIASHLMMTGSTITGQQAMEVGIIDEIAINEPVMDIALRYATSLSNVAPLALRATKKILKATGTMEPHKVRELQYQLFPNLWFSKDHKEAELAFTEKRKPKFIGK